MRSKTPSGEGDEVMWRWHRRTVVGMPRRQAGDMRSHCRVERVQTPGGRGAERWVLCAAEQMRRDI